MKKILEVRERAGLSSTIGTAGKVKAPLFGKDDFEQKLSREILTIGTEELKDMGGTISLVNLIEYFKRTRPNWKVKSGQIQSIINQLVKDNVIPPKIEIGENEVLVRFKPFETSSDISDILRLATGLEYLTYEIVSSHLGWSIERAEDSLKRMQKLDLAILDEEETRYYFPGIYKINSEDKEDE